MKEFLNVGGGGVRVSSKGEMKQAKITQFTLCLYLSSSKSSPRDQLQSRRCTWILRPAIEQEVSSSYQVYPLWLYPHRLFKMPMKTMVYPEPGFDLHRRQGNTPYGPWGALRARSGLERRSV